MNVADSRSEPSALARIVRTLSIPIILFWVLLAVGLAVVSPSIEVVAEEHPAPLSPADAPSYQAMMHIGAVFKEFDSDSSVMVVLEGQDKLGEGAHEFYDEIVRKLRADTVHVSNVQDFWVIR